MKIGAEDKKKLTIAVVVGVLGLASAIYIYSQLATPDVPAAAPAAVADAPAVTKAAPVAVAASVANRGRTETVVQGSGPGAKHEEPVSMDPTLRMGSMLLTEALVYSGSGRNIFSATSVPVAIPKPIAPARKVAPVAPPPVIQAGPPPPPPIDLKFFGTATATKSGTRQAFLLHGEDVFLASPGDIVQRRYRVVSIAANSMVVEDMTNNNRQTLPLLATY